LDVLEFEKSSFEFMFSNETPLVIKSLLKLDNVILSPHVAGWTVESHQKLAQTIIDKFILHFYQKKN
jgi:D-3-phosphoglycerate dehydrogenase